MFVVEAVLVIRGGGVADALDGGIVGGHQDLWCFWRSLCVVSVCVWLVHQRVLFVFETKQKQ